MKLLELRKNEKLTQEELAKKIDVTQKTYANYELGKTEPTIQTLCKLADYFSVTVDYLIDHKTYQLQLPALTDNQRKVIETTLKLDNENFGILYGFVMGLYEKQNKKQG